MTGQNFNHSPASLAERSGGDWFLRGMSADQVFALNPLPDNCIDAANRTEAMFDPSFPGWKLYCRVIRGETMFDRDLAAWAIGSARFFARSRKLNGRRVTSGGFENSPWIAQAGLDALEYVIAGKFAEPPHVTAARLGVSRGRYHAFRSHLMGFMVAGFQNYMGALHWQYSRVLWETKAAA